MGKSDNIKNELMIDIAKKYYLDGMSQDEIAKKLHMSRSNISRMLAKATESGVVQISIKDNRTLHSDVAYRISKKYGLKDTIIIPTHSEHERIYRHAGESIVDYLDGILENGSLVGACGGKTNFYVSKMMHNSKGIKVDVVQIEGCTENSMPNTDGYLITNDLAKRLNGIPYVLPYPLTVKSQELRDMLLSEPMCRQIISKYDNIDVALLEINTLQVRISSQLRDKWLSEADALQLREVDAVASVCGHCLDIRGKPCNVGINERKISISIEQLRRVPLVIGTGVGINMLESTLSILRSKLLDVLVVDEALAHNIDTYLR